MIRACAAVGGCNTASTLSRRWISCCRRALGELRSEEHTSELQSRRDLVCRLLLEKKKIEVDIGHRRDDIGERPLIDAISTFDDAALFGQSVYFGDARKSTCT